MGTSLLALETYQYTSLRPVDSTFRLLKLLKYQGPELECELFQQSLLNDEYTSYEALSYVWGSNELVECIKLDGKRLWVTDNLYSALQCLQLRDRDRYLWIDAICINQTDKEEQSQQVRQMGTIYKLARGVLFWLGKATSEIITLMEALQQLQSTGAELDLEQSMPDSGRSNNYRTGLRQLLGRQWFTRVWILQEVANAQKATVCCGIWAIPAYMFAQAPSLLGVEPEPHCQAVLDIMPGTSRSGSWWSQKRDLYALFCRFQASKATDERDKVYALLGLSSNPLDIRSVDIDYQQPTYEVIHKAITYLLRFTPISIHETLNLLKSFATLDTIYFVPAVEENEETEILFPHLQSGERLSRSEALENKSQGIAIVKNPSLLLLEERAERGLKDQETCYSEVVQLMLDVRAAKAQERQEYDDGLQVIPWGSIEQHVKLIVIRDRKRAILKAASQSCCHIVNKLLHMEIGGETRKSLEESTLQEAITQGHKMAIETILQQSCHVHKQNGMYDNLLQEAARQRNHNSQEVMALLLDRRGDEVSITQEVVVAAARNDNGKNIIALLLDRCGDEVPITQEVVVAAAENHYGEDIIALLLDQRGDEVSITQEVVVAAAGSRNGEDIIALLLDQRGDEVPITQEVVVAAAGNIFYSQEVMALLLDQRGDEVSITQEVVVSAAENHYGEDIIALLLDRRGDEVSITQEVVVAAAGSRNGEDIIALLLDRRGDEVSITQEVVVAAARNEDNGRSIIALLLDQRGDEVSITQEVVVAAAENHYGMDIIALLLDQRGDEVSITQEVVVAAAGNHYGEDIIALLLDRRGDEVSITQEVVVSAAENHYGEDIIALLLDRRGDEVSITQEVVVSAAENHYGEDIIALLLDQRGDEVSITQEVVVAATRNIFYSKDIIALLLDRRGDEVSITQEVVVAAAGSRNGEDIIALLLDQRGDEVPITQEVVVAAAGNIFYSQEVMALLLDQRGDEVSITQEVVVAAARNDNGKNIIALLLDQRGDEVSITQEVVVAAAENRYGMDIIALLLDRRGDEVPITQEVVVAAAGNHYGENIIALLLDRRGDEVSITQEVVVAAAGNAYGEGIIKYLHQVMSIDITNAVIQSAATSGQEKTLRLFDQLAQASIVSKHWTDIARLCTAAKKGDAEAILDLIQQGVPPDERDTRGTTPLWHAASRGHINTVRVLLETNAVDVNATSVDKRTPLFWPAAHGYVEVVKLLLIYGAQQKYEDKDGWSPLTIARIHGQTEIVEILEATND